MREGYSSATVEPLLNWIKTKRRVQPGRGIPFQADEHAFWYGGKTAARDLPGITGKVGDIKKGLCATVARSLGGIGHYSSWNWTSPRTCTRSSSGRLPQRLNLHG